MADKRIPSPSELRQLLRYDPETGKLYWLPRPLDVRFNTQFSGREAFTYTNAQGYKAGRIFDRGHTAHRVVWAIVHGEWPQGSIDHINQDRTDNRAANLRVVTHTENQRNMRRSKANTSGVTGVCWDSQKRRWRAEIMVDRKLRFIGYFKSFEDAASARKAAQDHYGFHANHGRE